MTDKIDLLPLPEDYDDTEGLWEKCYGPYSLEQMEDYARANVARAVEPLQAEIDALRTRLEDTVRDSTNKIEALRAEQEVIVAEAKKYAGESGRLKAKVELLAEALREAYGQVRELCGCYGLVYPEASFTRYEALLRDEEGR